jgi:outer membrane protein assembly factor BamB
MFRRFNRYNTQAPRERWRASAPIVVKDRVVLTSQDGTHVDCVYLRDGRMLWSVARDEADLYLAGVFDGRVLIVNKNAVKALDLQTGNQVWSQAKTGMPSGQGVAGDGVYYLPLASSLDLSTSERGPEICAIDIKTGKILGRSKVRQETPSDPETPGNLLFVSGDLISQSATKIAAFPLLKTKREEIDRALAKNANDAAGLTDRGEMFLYDGAIPQAVTDLRNALANNPAPPVRAKARTKLFSALTKWMQSDFNAAEKHLDEFAELCKVDNADEETRRRATYLELLGRGRERQGRVFDAFSAYEEYGKLGGNRELVASIEEPNTKARPDIWSRGRIQALIAGAKPEDRKRIEAEIERRWEKLRTSTSLDELRSFVALYGSLATAGMSARLELASRLIATGESDELTEAERVLAGLCYGSVQPGEDPALIARALDLMITLSMRRSQFENAVGFYKRLGTEFGDVKVRDGRTGRELWNDLPTDKRFIPYLETPGIVWPGTLSYKEEARNLQGRLSTTFTIEPSGELHPFFERHRLLFDVHDNAMAGTLRMVNRATNEEHRLPHNLPAPRGAANYYRQVWDSGALTNYDGRQPIAYARGDDLILHINNMIFAFDMVERKELWKKNLYGNDPLLNSQENNFESDDKNNTVVIVNEKKIPLGRIAAVEASYVALQTREGLEVLDPVMPGPNNLWSKGDVGLNATVFGDNRRLYVLDTDPEKSVPRLRILNAANGVVETPPDNVDALARKLTDAYPKKLGILRGRMLIADHGGKTIHLIDPASGKDIWSREFSNGTVVVQCDDQHLIGAIESAGMFTLLNALTGKVQFTSRLRPEHVEKLDSASLLSDHDHYYLVLARQPDQGVQSQSAMRSTMRSVRANGHIYGLFKKSGKLDWISEPVTHQYLVMEQMADLPVLLFTTQYSKSTNNVLEEQGVKVTGVIKSNGKMLLDKNLPSNTEFYALLPRPADGRIELQRQDRRLIIEAKKQ